MNHSSSNGVTVSVEVPMENLVHEITYEGVEMLQQPLTMSENLTRLAQKIDFAGKDENEDESEAKDDDGMDYKTGATWPWESVRNKLRSALTEMSVLGDIISVSMQKKYLVFDPVQAEPAEPRPATALLYKKKSLSAASSVLMSGCDRLRNSMNEAKSRSSMSSLPDFHLELLRLRQNWRLRKVGNAILGDLSYRTAGSRFQQQGIFEVSKAEEDTPNGDTTDDSMSSSGSKPSSTLRVTVPKELEGIAYIQVHIQKDQDILSLANITVPTPSPAPVEAHWQQKLEAAQNVLFCRELFSVLAREAVTLNTLPIPPLVVGNQITATLFPGILLIIGLCHGTPKVGGTPASASGIQGKPDHNHVLEHSLHQLLREVHRKNSCVPLPHPATAPIGVSKKRRLAGPLAYDRQILLQMTKKEGILEEMIRQSQHVVLRLRTMYVLDTLSKEIKDPFVVCHWASLNAVTHSCVRLNLLSSGYDVTAKTSLVIHVREKSLKCILKDGKAIHLSYEPQELRDVILCQIAIHQVMSLQSLSRCMGWSVLSSSAHLGVGNCENLGNAAGILLASPSGKRTIAVRSSPHSSQIGPQVFVGYPPAASTTAAASDSNNKDRMEVDTGFSFDKLSEDEPFESTEGVCYKPIRVEKLEGKNFLNKMEMLMAVLADAA